VLKVANTNEAELVGHLAIEIAPGATDLDVSRQCATHFALEYQHFYDLHLAAWASRLVWVEERHFHALYLVHDSRFSGVLAQAPTFYDACRLAAARLSADSL
jgi:hypothetical protein